MSALGDPTFKRRSPPLVGETGFKRRPLDFYQTEPWVTRALLGAVDFSLERRNERGDVIRSYLIWEPAVGDGRMAAELVRAGYEVFASDIYDYGWPGAERFDFLGNYTPLLPFAAIVTNQPFCHARGFVERAVERMRPCRGKVAMLHRHEFDAPQKVPAAFSAALSLCRKADLAAAAAMGRCGRGAARQAPRRPVRLCLVSVGLALAARAGDPLPGRG